MIESHWRSIVKALSWRIIATLVTFLVAYLLTREVVLSITIGFGDAIIKLGAYYYHERLWNRMNIGRKMAVKEEYNI